MSPLLKKLFVYHLLSVSSSNQRILRQLNRSSRRLACCAMVNFRFRPLSSFKIDRIDSFVFRLSTCRFRVIVSVVTVSCIGLSESLIYAYFKYPPELSLSTPSSDSISLSSLSTIYREDRVLMIGPSSESSVSSSQSTSYSWR